MQRISCQRGVAFEVTSIPETRLRVRSFGKYAPRYLHITAPVAKISLVNMEWTGEQRYHDARSRLPETIPWTSTTAIRDGPYVSFHISAGVSGHIYPFSDVESFTSHSTVAVPVIASRHRGSVASSPCIRFIILKDHGDFYERIGCLIDDLEVFSLCPSVVYTGAAGKLIYRT